MYSAPIPGSTPAPNGDSDLPKARSGDEDGSRDGGALEVGAKKAPPKPVIERAAAKPGIFDGLDHLDEFGEDVPPSEPTKKRKAPNTAPGSPHKKSKTLLPEGAVARGDGKRPTRRRRGPPSK